MTRLARFFIALFALPLLLWGCTNTTNSGPPGANSTGTPTGAGSATPQADNSAPQTSIPSETSTSAAPEETTPPDQEATSPDQEATSPDPTGAEPSSTNGSVYTEEEMSYFQDIALGSEFGGSPETVKKWLQDVDIRVSGSPTEEDVETLDDVVSDLNGLISTVDIQLVDDDADINIYIVPLNEFRDYVPEYVDGNDGYFYYRYREAGELYAADIVVRSEGIDQNLRSHLLREELTQSFGLAKDSDLYLESIFFQGTSYTESYSDIDETLIKILYRPEITPGLTKEGVETALKSP